MNQSNCRRSSVKGGSFLVGTLILAACSSLSHQKHSERWSLDEDFLYYQTLYEKGSSTENSVFPAYLNAARRSEKYRAMSERLAQANCIAWIAFQSVEVQSSRYELVFFCKSGGGGWNVIGSDALIGEMVELKTPALTSEIDGFMTSTLKFSGPYFSSAFDAPCFYVSVFDGARLNRFSVYAPADKAFPNEPAYSVATESGYNSASALVRDIQATVERIKTKENKRARGN